MKEKNVYDVYYSKLHENVSADVPRYVLGCSKVMGRFGWEW